jgi:type IV secretory pathway TraG/TraD family ATPase VirD4
MVRQRETRATGADTEAVLLFTAIGAVIVVVGGVWVSLHTAARLDHHPAPAANPFTLIVQVVSRQQAWPRAATYVAAAIGLVLLVLAVLVTVLGVRRGSGRLRSDAATRYLARPRDVAHLTEKPSLAKAKRLGVTVANPGVPIGRYLLGGAMLYGSWEDMHVDIAGPRTNKTTARVIPTVLAAPGAVLVTSNKRDVVDATRDPRDQVGTVWIFDPQQVADEPPAWWWDPLTYVTDEVQAEKLAAQFAASSRRPGARTDAYFDGEAENLIGLLLLAAAEAGKPIVTVYSWLTAPADLTPARTLADRGYPLQADSLEALSTLPDKQRDGVYGTARALMGFLRNRRTITWVTPPTGHREAFDPRQFAGSTDTLYLLSREGDGSAGPLVAALTVAVVEAAETLATRSPGGRLPVPLVAVLDEAANICRFRNLDSYYSHFGSRGIVILTILQNWAQGEEVWGKAGMEKLWSAANIKLYGGGVDDDRFLRRLSDLIGSYDRVMTSESHSRGHGRQRSRSVQERTILTIAELRELPRGRAILFASGTPAAMIEPQPWYDNPTTGAVVQASIDNHTPTALDGAEVSGSSTGRGSAA